MSVLVSANRNKGLFLALSFLLLALFGYVDYVTGPEIFFSFFYLIPIAFMCWFFGLVPGICFSLLCTIVVTATDAQFDPQGIFDRVIYWNAAMRTSFYLIFCVLMVFIRKELFNEYSKARLDPLTGVFNTRAFFEVFSPESLGKLFTPPFTVAYLDLDDFKRVNDQQGHKEGDRLLRLVAQTMEKSVRGTDVIARLGGDEFVIAFPATDSGGAQAIIRSLRKNLSQAVRKLGFPVTFSIGLATYHQAPRSTDEVVKTADELMYAVKRKGKNAFKATTLPAARSGVERRKMSKRG